tara:strand:+ start:1936 stop:2088 length:153 start_codon:yes stop_codon:yes gene_type:complete
MNSRLVGFAAGLFIAAIMGWAFDNIHSFYGGLMGACSYVICAEIYEIFRR